MNLFFSLSLSSLKLDYKHPRSPRRSINVPDSFVAATFSGQRGENGFLLATRKGHWNTREAEADEKWTKEEKDNTKSGNDNQAQGRATKAVGILACIIKRLKKKKRSKHGR